MQLELAERGFGDDDGVFGEGDAGARLAAGFEEKDAVPVGAAGGNVVDIENQVGKALVEDARLHLKRDLRGDEGSFDVAEGAKAEGREVGRRQKRESRADDGEDANGKEDAFAADAQGGEGDDFAVHGHAAQAEEDADKDGHGNGENEKAGDDTEEEGEDLRAGAAVADEEFHEADEFGDEQYEGKNEEAQESVTYNFPNNVTIEDAHDANRECNMGMESYEIERIVASRKEEEEGLPQRSQRGRPPAPQRTRLRRASKVGREAVVGRRPESVEEIDQG
jgi:hypothetical protein